jgi:hypothetical protein
VESIVMQKQWEEMTQPEKIEELRNDVKHILDLLNQFQVVIAKMESDATSWLAEAEDRVDQFGQMVVGLSRRIEQAERRMDLSER